LSLGYIVKNHKFIRNKAIIAMILIRMMALIY